ncbi:UNVERIFIED_CONTAM: atad-3 [Trichonephila clavipes]
MSWLFGLRKDPVPDLSSLGIPTDPTGGQGEGQPAAGGGASGSGSNDDRKSMSYRFDSTALERAAKAARELEQSGMNI